MKSIGLYIVNLFFLIWAHSPVLSLTDDENFPNIKFKSKEEKEEENEKNKFRIRLSLISLYWGEGVLHFLTFSFDNKKFEKWKIIQISKLPQYNMKKEIDDFKQDYEKHISSLKNDKRKIEKESLIQHISNENQRVETSLAKINIYTAIIAFLFPLFAIITKDEIFEVIKRKVPLETIIALLFFYCIINMYVMMFQSIKVRSILKSTFRDLRQSNDKVKVFLLQLYFDWQHLQRKASMYVSFVYSMHDWIVLSLMLGVISVFINKTSIAIPNNLVIASKETVFTLDMREWHNVYGDCRIDFTKIMLALQEKKYNRVLILYNNVKENDLQEIFNIFSEQKVIYIFDKSLESDKIKVILE